MRKMLILCVGILLLVGGCSDVLVGGVTHGVKSGDDNTDTGIDTESGDDNTDTGIDTESDIPLSPMRAELWYAVEQSLMYIELDSATGAPIQVVESELTGDTALLSGFNSITMLVDGSLLGARLPMGSVFTTQIYHIPNPPRDGSPAAFVQIGIMPNNIALEALYTDCNGRLYGMDTGVHVGNAIGNRLIRFNDDYLAGSLTFDVVTDLSEASWADVDDMSPGIDSDGHITDNPGYAIDSQHVYNFNFLTGTSSPVAVEGRWGIHAIGGTLFNDGVSRLYVLSEYAELFRMDPRDYSTTDALIQGPQEIGGTNSPGYSGLTGPLTACETGFALPL